MPPAHLQHADGRGRITVAEWFAEDCGEAANDAVFEIWKG